jgi:uncharacterized membrane protein
MGYGRRMKKPLSTETLQGGRIASILVFIVCTLLATKYWVFFFLCVIPLVFYFGFSIAYSRRTGLYKKRYEWAQKTFGRPDESNEKRDN